MGPADADYLRLVKIYKAHFITQLQCDFNTAVALLVFCSLLFVNVLHVLFGFFIVQGTSQVTVCTAASNLTLEKRS